MKGATVAEQEQEKQEQEQEHKEVKVESTGNPQADTLLAEFLPMVNALASASRVTDSDRLAGIKLAVELAISALTSKEALGQRVQDSTEVLTDALSSLAAASTDVIEEKAAKVRSFVNLAEVFPDLTNTAPLTEALSAWDAARPKSKGSGNRTGASAAPDLGFKVAVTCQKCKKEVSTTGKRDVNSLRWAIKKHAQEAHSTSIDKGTPSFVGVTAAIESVFGDANAAEGGGFTISRRGGEEVAA